MQLCISVKVLNLHRYKYLISNFLLGGLLEDINYDAKSTFGDPRLRFHFAQADKLPEPARNLIINIIAAVVAYLGTGGIDP